MHRFGLVQEHLGLHPGVGRFGARLVEQHHQDDPLEVIQVKFVLVKRHCPVHHQLPLAGIEDAVLLQEQEEPARIDVELVLLGLVEDPDRPIAAWLARRWALSSQSKALRISVLEKPASLNSPISGAFWAVMASPDAAIASLVK